MDRWHYIPAESGHLRVSVLKLRAGTVATAELNCCQCLLAADDVRVSLYLYSGEKLDRGCLERQTPFWVAPVDHLLLDKLARFLDAEELAVVAAQLAPPPQAEGVNRWRLFECHDGSLQLVRNVRIANDYAAEHSLPQIVAIAIGTNGVYLYCSPLSSDGLAPEQLRHAVFSPRQINDGSLASALAKRDIAEVQAIFMVNARELFNIIPGGKG